MAIRNIQSKIRAILIRFDRSCGVDLPTPPFGHPCLDSLNRRGTRRARIAVLSVFLFGGSLQIKPPLHSRSVSARRGGDFLDIPLVIIMAKIRPAPVQKTHDDESSINLERIRQSLPQWLQRFLPSGGGFHHDAHGQAMFGFTIFLVSESLIFVSFFVTYILLRNSITNGVPPGVKGPQISTGLVIATVVLLSSSFVIYFAERSLQRGNIARFRFLWVLTSVMGLFFLLNTAKE